MTAINETTATDLATTSLTEDIDRLKRGQVSVMSSFTGSDRATQISVLSAMSSATPLDDVLGKEFKLANFVVQGIEMPDEETGELREVPRLILVDDSGKAYHAISQGVFSSLKNITAIMGMPGAVEGMWPVKVKAKREKTRKGYQVFTLEILG